ncbi:hypothetical protein HDU92_005832 [Lobulomyces angularis]|nr:hypothetical protein HDU92_005832 [Lobulomyces angularis]
MSTFDFEYKTKIFVTNLSSKTEDIDLIRFFQGYGKVTDANVMMEDGKSKNCGFVHFETSYSVTKVLKDKHRLELDGKYIKVFLNNTEGYEEEDSVKKKRGRGDTENTRDKGFGRRCFIYGLNFKITDDELQEYFDREIGPVLNAKVVVDRSAEEKSKGFGFVTFKNQKDFEKACKIKMFYIKDHEITVSYANEPERSIYNHNQRYEDRGRFDERRSNFDRGGYLDGPHRKVFIKEKGGREGGYSYGDSDSGEKFYGGPRVFVGGLCPTTNCKSLFEFFSYFGMLKFSKVMCDELGRSKGFGYITFRNIEDVERVLHRKFVLDGQEIGCRLPVECKSFYYYCEWEERRDREIFMEMTARKNFERHIVHKLKVDIFHCFTHEAFSVTQVINFISAAKNCKAIMPENLKLKPRISVIYPELVDEIQRKERKKRFLVYVVIVLFVLQLIVRIMFPAASFFAAPHAPPAPQDPPEDIKNADYNNLPQNNGANNIPAKNIIKAEEVKPDIKTIINAETATTATPDNKESLKKTAENKNKKAKQADKILEYYNKLNKMEKLKLELKKHIEKEEGSESEEDEEEIYELLEKIGKHLKKNLLKTAKGATEVYKKVKENTFTWRREKFGRK